VHTKGLDDEKIQLKNEIKELERKLGKGNVKLASFILSKTPYDKLIDGQLKPPSKEEYIQHNVLFLDDKNWPETLLGKILLEFLPSRSCSHTVGQRATTTLPC
jgi:hypothetical protein